MTEYRKKLIEVALPLEAINIASAREKTIKVGKPTSVHLWWARRPLVACRAIIFASIIDDPDQEGVPAALLKRIDELPNPPGISLSMEKLRLEFTKLDEATLNQKRIGMVRRAKLFNFIEGLVQWENSNDEKTLKTARELIMAATDGNPPTFLDPFCGGGSIPLEAQRLGLEAHGSDLNPVAVLITKALIELPPKFANQPPINPESRKKFGHGTSWKGASGLAEDVRYYGQWMRDEAFKRIGHLYPKVQLPREKGGGEATVIAWLWARTVKCPNPACGAQMPLVSSFSLSTKKGKEVWIEPQISNAQKTITFNIKSGAGTPSLSSKMSRGAKFKCLICNQSAEEKYIKRESIENRMGAKMLAIVAEGSKGRIYLPPNITHESISLVTRPTDVPNSPLSYDPRNIWCTLYGLDTFDKLFTPRQLVALTTFSNLVDFTFDRIIKDTNNLDLGIEKANAYANAIITYLSLAISRTADWGSTLGRWESKAQVPQQIFARQAIAMAWDYSECNIFSISTGSFIASITNVCRSLLNLPIHDNCKEGKVLNRDVTSISNWSGLISTDPPYYDNISYAGLSDFFYVWLRRCLGKIYPDLFSTLLVPKSAELVADQYRFKGNKEEAQIYFENGLSKAFTRLQELTHLDYPITVYYAFKQAEIGNIVDSSSTSISSTGWETMLEGLIKAGFAITGTWPIRTEMSSRMVGQGTNVLASSIVLVCRSRPQSAALATRRDFLNALKRELPAALRQLQEGNIAPVDLAQASIGPGMAVFSRYSKVVESDGTPMRVRTALQLINQSLDEVLAEQEGEYDADTRWAIKWFEQYGLTEGAYGSAETLSKAVNTAVEGLVEAGFLYSKAGKVRLLHRDELDPDWDPRTDRRLTVWEVTQHLIHALDKQGEPAAAELLTKVGGLGEIARDLAYRLYTTCERKGWSQEALAYNTLVVQWPEILKLSAEKQANTVVQGNLGF
ncbi:MAG: DUF1156 domain-containing protein [Chloroflexi bacterium]|uniref:DUF1156 domain-containing protein n=1 Tax=Candidatus Chlorohelix allophototropha TaxID=3003348 RepID=A0A8T7MAZ3_9CHLR|nr:DUF1156 domain-containing protein [Chloroflexota bacterium]WJW70365.1 DUF1156 domain-containing protein [Chloroflexota bacterium L227-S17]